MVDFANAYVQENDLLSELLGDDQDVYQKNYYESDGYDGEKLRNLYAYEDPDDATVDTGYDSVDEASSSGDELPIPSDGYTEAADLLLDDTNEEEANSGYSYGTAVDDNYYTKEDVPPAQENTNLKASVALVRTVSVPVVRLEEEIKEGFEKKDWNKTFQSILALPESEAKYQKLSQLAHEFIFVAETYGKVIISEINVPMEHKTIKPISIGGQAGGEKYIAQGILFKFALDVGNLYGGNDEYAQKAAGHDLKGLIQYSLAGIPGLHFPLMSLIHYMGYCLIAMSLLPIGKDTLKYGSADAGKTMHFDIPAINEKMKAAGEALNLKGHIAGFAKYQTNLCYGPGDIECHLGKDNRFYVLDFARTFPPEAILPGTVPQKGQILFKLLRPELVKSNGVPLSSDAFTGFGMGDPAHKTHNREVAEATERLFTKVIPNLAERIIKEDVTPSSAGNYRTLSVLDGTLISELHKEGVNIRHMGYVRRKVGENCSTHNQFLVEMIARIVKNKLKKQWRAITKVNQHITEEQCKQVTVVMLNNLYSDSEAATKFWTEKMPKNLKKKFRYALFKSEKDKDLRVVLHNYFFTLLTRIQQITGIVLSSTAISDTKGFKQMTFVHSDIERVNAVVKNMHIVEVADTQLLLWNGIRSSGPEAERILSLASKKLEQNSLMSLQLTKILKLVYQLYQKTKKIRSENSLMLALKLLDVVVRVQPKTELAYILYGKVLFIKERDRTNGVVIKKLSEGLEQIPTSALLHAELLKKRVQMLYGDYNEITDEQLEQFAHNYNTAINEMYLKGVTDMYYAALLMLCRPQRMQEAFELMKVGQALTPHKFESILKMIIRRVTSGYGISIPYDIIMAVQPLVPKDLYHLFDSINSIETKNQVNDAVLATAKDLFGKISSILLQRNEVISTAPAIELIKARADSLEILSLTKFDDLPQELVEILKKCQALVRLELIKTNLTLDDVINVLECVKLQILSIPAINDLTPVSLTKVLAFTNIKDLNISNTTLSREDMATVLEQANVKRLFLDNINTVDMDLVKIYVTRNNELTCLSLAGTPIKERELMEYFPKLGHASLQALILPHGSTLTFSGAFIWTISTIVMKLPTGSRIEIRLNCDGAHDSAAAKMFYYNISTMNGQSIAHLNNIDSHRSLASMQETTLNRTMTFSAVPDPPNEKFSYGSIQVGMQTILNYIGERHVVIQQAIVNTKIFGCDINIPQFAPPSIRVPPRKDITFLIPLLVSFILKRKATL